MSISCEKRYQALLECTLHAEELGNKATVIPIQTSYVWLLAFSVCRLCMRIWVMHLLLCRLGYMFWSDVYTKQIAVAQLDGTGLISLVNSSIDTPGKLM